MAGVRAASADVICSASAIPTINIAQALAHRPLCVPLLQRRYCWAGPQLGKFLSDAVRLTRAGAQEETLVAALRRPTGPLIGTGHALGRVVVSRKKDRSSTNSEHVSQGEGDRDDNSGAHEETQRRRQRRGVTVLDGQQRFTTAVLLLVAIRDMVAAAAVSMTKDSTTTNGHRDGEERNEADSAARTRPLEEKTTARTAAMMASLIADLNKIVGGGGVARPTLVPTHFDRAAMIAALTGTASENATASDESGASPSESRRDNSGSGTSADAITPALCFFRQQLQSSVLQQVGTKVGWVNTPHDEQQAAALKTDLSAGKHEATPQLPATLVAVAGLALAKAVLLEFRVLWFEAQEDDIWSVYERLAFREVMLSGMLTNNSKGIPLAEADLTRNYLVSFFDTEARQLDVYHEYWVPAEQAAIRAAAAQSGNARPLLDVLCAEFIEHRATLVPADAEDTQLSTAGGAGHLASYGAGFPVLFATYKGMRRLVESELVRAGLMSPDGGKATSDKATVSTEDTRQTSTVVEGILSDFASFASETPWAAVAAEKARALAEKARAANAEAAQGRASQRRHRSRNPGGNVNVMVGPETGKFATTMIPARK
eukprot:m.174794 g.174794  ORF g.174794 m.174794 type:complete len:601 (-) comp13873_c0_seq1:129-1931(-)